MKLSNLKRRAALLLLLVAPAFLTGCYHAENKGGATSRLWNMQIVGVWHEEGYEFYGITGGARLAKDGTPVFSGVVKHVGASGVDEGAPGFLVARDARRAHDVILSRIKFLELTEAPYGGASRLKSPCCIHGLDLEPDEWTLHEGIFTKGLVPESGDESTAVFPGCADRPVTLREVCRETDGVSRVADTSIKLLGTPPALVIDLVRVAGNILICGLSPFVGGTTKPPL